MMVNSYELARFFDSKFEYLQHSPPAFFPNLMAMSPYLDGPGRRLAGRVKAVYTSQVLNEPFENSLEQRRNVKFGVLIPYLI